MPQTLTIDLVPASAVDAVEALTAMSGHLPTDAPGHVFLDFYTVVTRRVTELLAEGAPGFRDPLWLDTLTALFAHKALMALHAFEHGDDIESTAWELAVYSQPNAQPYQYALLGMNAHINYDLPRVVLPYLDAHPNRISDYRHDYFEVISILDSVADESIRMIADKYHCHFTQLILALPGGTARTHRSIMQLVNYWRTVVWNTIESMHRAPTRERQPILMWTDIRAENIARRILS